MKFKLFLLLTICCVPMLMYAQSNVTSISYNLSVTFTSNTIQLTTIGGDLTIDGAQNTQVPICSEESKFSQNIYTGSKLANAAFNLSNIAGNGCVTVIITTTTGKSKVRVAAGAESGVLRFANVTSIIVTIDSKASSTVPETMTSSGKVQLWF